MMKKNLLICCFVGLYTVSNAQIQLAKDLTFGVNGVFTYQKQTDDRSLPLIYFNEDNTIFLTIDAQDAIIELDRFILKIKPDGTLDNTFANNGRLQLVNGSNPFHTLLPSTEGKFYINYSDPFAGNIDNRIVSYNSNGTINTLFANSGVMPYDFYSDSGQFSSTQDGGLLLTKYDGYTKYNQLGAKDNSFGVNGELAFDFATLVGTSIFPIAKGNGKLFYGGIESTIARIGELSPDVIEAKGTSAIEEATYISPLNYPYHVPKVKNDNSIYYIRGFKYSANSSDPYYTNIRLMKRGVDLVGSKFGTQDFIELPLKTAKGAETIFFEGNYIVTGTKNDETKTFLAYDENGNSVNINGSQFYSDSEVLNYTTTQLYTKDDALYLVGYAGDNEVVIVKYKSSNATLATNDMAVKDFAVSNPFNASIDIKDANHSIRKMDLYDYNGRLIISTDKAKMNTSNLPSGNYILKITSKTGKVINKKLIKTN